MLRLLRPLISRRTYAELLYVLLALPLAIAGFAFALTAVSVSAGLTLIFIGVPLLAVTLAIARLLGGVERGLGRSLLGVEVDAPRRLRRTRGWIHLLSDRVGWRALAFLVLRLPVAVLDVSLAIAFWSSGLAGTTYWYWRHFLPAQYVHGVPHRGANFGTGYFLDTPSRVLVVTIIGLGSLISAPWVVHGALTLERLMIPGLLGPTTAAERVRQLETTRTIAVDDAAAALRRIERDLHDGAQARLVALAMSLGLAKEELNGDDAHVVLGRVRKLVDDAHREAKATIVDLRDLARGIHPPALDNGLPDALSTLAARSSIPVSVHVALEPRPTPALESIVYFCAAELITNVVKHSGAHRASVRAIAGDHHLVLCVEDDGTGGAEARAGGGLRGLSERVATVDGTLHIMSPPGGPTSISIEIPH